jgi:hypothetical protein
MFGDLHAGPDDLRSLLYVALYRLSYMSEDIFLSVFGLCMRPDTAVNLRSPRRKVYTLSVL